MLSTVVATASILPLLEHLSVLLIAKIATDPKTAQDVELMLKELHTLWNLIGPEHQHELEEWLAKTTNTTISCFKRSK